MTVDTPNFRRGVLVAVAAVLVALTAWLALNPSPAQAGVRKYKNLATGFCLDSNLAGKAYTHNCNAGAFQRWNVTGGKTVRLKNVRTGRCLDSNTRQQAYTLPCNGGNFQRWRVFYNANGTRTFKNVSTGFCLDSNTRQRLYTHRCNGGSFQKWRLG
jgi:Ricin-type beta-trefoil lectin domain